MSGKRVPLIAGNWKMNGLRAEGVALAEAVARGTTNVTAEVAVCPPATLLFPVGAALAGSAVALGAQDCHVQRAGAFTGDVSAEMLKDAGCRYVIVGHSERRTLHHETNDIVRQKSAAALSAGLRVIICVGESEAQRLEGLAVEIVEAQLRGSMPVDASADSIVVAYEPIWAIGTGRTATPDDIADIHGVARRCLAKLLPGGEHIRLLYGGSVKPGNAAEILALEDVDGALVGGASLKAEDFLSIVAAVPR